MNLLKRTSPPPPSQGSSSNNQQQASMFGGRLTPSPHYTSASTPGSPLTTHQHRGQPPNVSSTLLLQMGGENSAFKALVPNLTAAATTEEIRRLSGYMTDSDEEINVNDESDMEEEKGMMKSRSSSPVEVVDPPGKDTQPLQLTMHNRD